jgi:diguanylate cyclase (GGDEF)-like protein
VTGPNPGISSHSYCRGRQNQEVISDTAARVMSLAQCGDAQEALRLAEHVLESGQSDGSPEQAALWYAVAVAHHVAGDNRAQAAAAQRALEIAWLAVDPGWASNALSMRAMAQIRQNRVEPALLDLARAELELEACADAALRCWAHTGLGYSYLELRLYELALPHLEAALELEASPIPLREAHAIDLMNLAELHLRWADELERVEPYESARAEAEERRAVGHRYAVQACKEAGRVGATALGQSCRALELSSRPPGSAADALPALRDVYDTPHHADYQGGRAAAGGALARVLWRVGRRDEALAVARQAVALSQTAGDWQVAASVRWLLVEMESMRGVPGAASGRDYGRLLSRVLWQQRLATLQGARAALEAEKLHHDKAAAMRAANEDHLTGVGNRRALDRAMEHATTAPRPDPVSLLVVDLDDFKRVNDTYGHVVGDEVLRAVAAAIRAVARSTDLVARLGGDEFVILAPGSDERAGAALSRRIRDAIAEVRVPVPGGVVTPTVSVGVGTTGPEVTVPGLLQAADRDMYRWKRRPSRTRFRVGG